MVRVLINVEKKNEKRGGEGKMREKRILKKQNMTTRHLKPIKV